MGSQALQAADARADGADADIHDDGERVAVPPGQDRERRLREAERLAWARRVDQGEHSGLSARHLPAVLQLTKGGTERCSLACCGVGPA